MNQYLLTIMKGQRQGFWAQLIICFLWPFSIIYRFGVFCHRSFYLLIGAYKAPKPVISIGNITVGGVGKTPLVIWLAQHLQRKGLKAIILIRGYMSEASKDSDEVDMINEQIPFIPVLAGKDRVSNIRKYSNTTPVDLYIADDAFQHWPLDRDLNVVAIDAVNPFGNGHLLPAGILREDVLSLKRADVFILTKIDGAKQIQVLTSRLREINPQALIVESIYKTAGAIGVFDSDILTESFLKDKPVAAFCAIGDPLSFELSLKNSGATLVHLFTFMDHHIYQKDDVERMVRFCHEKDLQVIVTTHKDAVKLKNYKDLFSSLRLVYIPIQLEITKGSDEFIHKIISICHR